MGQKDVNVCEDAEYAGSMCDGDHLGPCVPEGEVTESMCVSGHLLEVSVPLGLREC